MGRRPQDAGNGRYSAVRECCQPLGSEGMELLDFELSLPGDGGLPNSVRECSLRATAKGVAVLLHFPPMTKLTLTFHQSIEIHLKIAATNGRSSRIKDAAHRSRPLQIQISARHGQIDDADRERMTEKAGKLVRYFDRLTSILITVDMARLDQPELEIRATAEGHDDFVGTDKATNIFAALDGALHKVEAQLKKHKGKSTEYRSHDKHVDPPES